MFSQQGYALATTLILPYEEGVKQVTSALQENGFGILTEIDVQATLKQKLGVDTQRYVILGACNPHLAHQALQAEPEVGLLLPCNVIVYEDQNTGKTQVSIADPVPMVEVIGNPVLIQVANEARSRLEQVLAALEDGTRVL